MVPGCVPFKIVFDSPTFHSRWLLFFKIMIISLWDLLQYHSIVRWVIQAQWAEPLVCPVIENFIWIEPLLRGLSYICIRPLFLCPNGDLLIQVWLSFIVAFAIVPTDKICERSLSSKIPVGMNSIFMKLCDNVTWPMWHISEIWIFEEHFLIRQTFVGRNTSNHACQIFWSKSNCETMYHWFFPPRGKKKSECLLRP